ncbi:uncharacterized protein A1O9_01524 [Exophiala aquamarina CBS 119918]|uniref:Xylanolytic transcriptional activator regulatory domain-containing protein n=1 Tax=Exophiala aquamarina CBS 119918 TaxID=1182545 RepID=A0A072PUK8_9EURO|nr:uncharacterized protein A1O9_01524 [Exophiala aquamarina CBS 119918]KEF63546.1 hypothetical protein A1O9_01524 [Exophiala aquamarina CBS 119918]
MFAGISFLEAEKVNALGFATKRDARRVFHDRARLLYDLDAESDQLTILQSVLLLTSWSETPGDSKGTWHWMGVAVSLAFGLGLHRKTLDTPDTRRINRLRRRIWWSCYLRDHMIALTMSRAMRIRDDEFNTIRLTREDFDTADMVMQSLQGAVPQESLTLPSPSALQMLAEMCIFMIELAGHAGAILTLQYSTLPPDDIGTEETSSLTNSRTMLFPKLQPDMLENVIVCEEEIQKWFRSRPESCFHAPGTTLLARQDPSIVLHQTFIHMAFQAVVSALHRPLVILKVQPSDHRTQELQRLSQLRIFEAGIEISRACHDLRINGLEDMLPPTAILIQIPAIMSHIPRVRLHKEGRAHDPLRAILNSLKVCETLQEVHPGVDVVMNFLITVLKRAHIELIKDGHGKILYLYNRCVDNALVDQSKSKVGSSARIGIDRGADIISSLTATGNDRDGWSRPSLEAPNGSAPAAFDSDPTLSMAPLLPQDCTTAGVDEVSLALLDAINFDDFGLLMDLDDSHYLDKDGLGTFDDVMAEQGTDMSLLMI